jgi:penicillin amidase
LAASNNWVISGSRTVTGKPLLADDPHLRASAPSIWHMVHLSSPGVRVAGVTSPGLPGVIIGHNERIAWGFTNVGPDVQDLYLEKFDPANPKRYQTPQGWQDAVIRQEQIKVRKGFTSEYETVVHDVTVTRHGPIIFEADGKRYALRWTALDPRQNRADISYSLNRARNWKEFNAALESFTAPTQNIVYADVDGHIGYHAAGVVPIRKSGDGSVPYDGSTDAGEWTSYIPVSKLPTLYDPPSGIIVTANQRIVGTDYPYFLTHSWAQPYRARRIFDLLNEKPKHSVEDFRRIQGDVYSIAGKLFAQETVKLLKPKLKSGTDALVPNRPSHRLSGKCGSRFARRSSQTRLVQTWCKIFSGAISTRRSIASSRSNLLIGCRKSLRATPT